MKKILLSIVYTLIIVFVAIILYLEISSRIDAKLYGYEKASYSHQLDFIFNPQALNQVKVEAFYKSGEKGSICFIITDTLSKVAVIESSNFKDILPDDVQIDGIDKIKRSQNKTYRSFANNYFPLISQALNPKQSTYLRILFQYPYKVDHEIKGESYYYLKGNFRQGAFGNSQICSLISYRNSNNNELLIVKNGEKFYFIMQTDITKSLLEIVNPALLKE